MQRARFMTSPMMSRSIRPSRSISIYCSLSDMITIGSNPSIPSFIQRNPSIMLTNYSPPFFLISNCSEAIPLSWSAYFARSIHALDALSASQLLLARLAREYVTNDICHPPPPSSCIAGRLSLNVEMARVNRSPFHECSKQLWRLSSSPFGTVNSCQCRMVKSQKPHSIYRI